MCAKQSRSRQGPTNPAGDPIAAQAKKVYAKIRKWALETGIVDREIPKDKRPPHVTHAILLKFHKGSPNERGVQVQYQQGDPCFNITSITNISPEHQKPLAENTPDRIRFVHAFLKYITSQNLIHAYHLIQKPGSPPPHFVVQDLLYIEEFSIPRLERTFRKVGNGAIHCNFLFVENILGEGAGIEFLDFGQ